MLQIMRINAVSGVAWIAAIFCALQVGCVTHARGRWNPPVMAPPDPSAAPRSSCFGVVPCAATLELIEPGNAVPIPAAEPADLPPRLPAEGFWRNRELNVGPQRLPAIEPEPPTPLPSDQSWGEPIMPMPQPIPEGPTRSGPIAEIEIKSPPRDDRLLLAESYYAMAMDADKKVDEHAMSLYLDAILGAWDYMLTAPVEGDISKHTGRAWIIYHSSLARLIHIAASTGRFEKNIRIRIPEDYGFRVLEIEYAGFAWRADEFNEWNVVGEYQSKYLLHHYKRPGLGVPLVIVRNHRPDDQFLPAKTPFNATAVLRPLDDEFRSEETMIPCPDSETHVERLVGTLQLFNPDEFDDVEFRECQTALAADWTALFAYMLSHPQPELQRSSHHGLGEPAPAGLFMLEPHQPGRIPIVFVHGLLSAPYTWAAMANELYAYPELHKRYEIWAFQYPTDEPFLESAAVLRRQLDCAVHCSDPKGTDPALDNMVVVGHSMGGLIAKLLAAPSGNTLWQHAAFVPIEEVVAPKDVRIRLQQSFFFPATPYVKRVVYIATPHEGSSWARRCLGQATSLAIEGIEHRSKVHKEVVNANPAAFREELRRRPPTSIDLLEPNSMILKGIYQLDVAPEVSEHSIIGRGWWSIHDGASDGVVPVKSARLPGVDSEVMVSATHTHLNKHPGAICEVMRILQLHADQLPWVQPHLVGQCEPK